MPITGKIEDPDGNAEKTVREPGLPRPEDPGLLAPSILRRADWRVLLPVPEKGFDRMVVLGGPHGLDRALRELGAAREVSRDVPKARRTDAVAILSDANARWPDIAGALRPGGTVYWEFHAAARPLAWTRWTTRRKLRAMGLSLTGLYWIRPDFERAELFVPVHWRSPLDWYSGTLADAAPGFWRVFPFRLARRAAKLLIRIRPIRHLGVTATLDPAPKPIASILSHPAVESVGGGAASPFVVARPGADGSRRLIVLPFRRETAQPPAVLKFSRFVARNADVEREQEIAATIRARLDARMRESIPTPLGTFLWGRSVVGVESYAGRPIQSDRSRNRRIEDLRRVACWLSEFHRQSGTRPEPFSPAQMERWIEGPLEDYWRTFSGDSGERMLFDDVRSRGRALLGTPLPLVWSHPALSERNICRSNGDIRVIDWEAAEIGPPLRDLIYFLTLWYHGFGNAAGEEDRARSFRRLYFGSGPDPLRDLVWKTLGDHMRSLAVDRRFFPVLLALTWVEHALGRVKRTRAFGGGEPEDRSANRHIALIRVLAANRERLFSGDAP